jgi:hypothetical protein
VQCALSERARLFLKLVVVVGDDLVVQQKIIIILIHLRKNVRQRFVHDVDDLFALEQLAVLLNREIAVKFVQYVLRIGRGFDAFLVIQCPSIHGIQHLAPFKFDGRVDALIHEIRQRAFGAAKTAVYGVASIGRNALGDVNGRRVEFTRVPKTTRPAGACPNVLKHVALVKTQLQMV